MHGELTSPAASADMGDRVGLFQELLGSDHLATLEFFVVGLRDVSESATDEQELLYNASVLAHYAQVSIDPDDELSTPADLTAIYDRFVANPAVLLDSAICRIGTLEALNCTMIGG